MYLHHSAISIHLSELPPVRSPPKIQQSQRNPFQFKQNPHQIYPQNPNFSILRQYGREK